MSGPLSPEREQQIRAFEAAATPGPWHRHDDAEDLRRWVIDESNVLHIDFGYRGNSTQRDAEFVADARTAVPELLAELDRVRAGNTALLDLVADFVDHDACDLDLHGYCQAHMWFNPMPCPHGRAKAMFADTKTEES